MHGRSLVAVATAAVLLGPVATAALAEPEQETRSFTYVAPHLGGSGNQGPDGFALTGVLRFTPSHSTYTLTIDDAGVLTGQTVPVRLPYPQPGQKSSTICVPVRTPTTLVGGRPGVRVEVSIGDQADSRLLRGNFCTGYATAGTATVVL